MLTAPGLQDSLLPAFPCKKFINGQDFKLIRLHTRRYWGWVYACMLPRPPPKDGSCVLTLDALFFLCLNLPEATSSRSAFEL